MLRRMFLTAALLLAAVPGVEAALVDYVGFGFETGGLDPSDPGDAFTVAAVATQIDPIFGVDLGGAEATIYIYDLVSTGAFTDPGTGWTFIGYTGGTLDLYEDASMDHDWGILPPNASVPSSFTNGTLRFRGSFTSFTLTLSPTGAGVFEGVLDGVGGSSLATLCSDCAYSFAGTFTAAVGAQLPEGYDLQVDGTLEVDSAVGVTRDHSWGSLKALYDN